jgi:DNA-binding response OmpR family regulator
MPERGDNGARGSILVVEDERRVAHLIATVLERAACQVEVASSLAEARAAVIRQEFDAVMVDLILPDGDGLEFAESLRRRHPVAIVVMSGLSELSVPSGVVVLAKPFTPDLVEHALIAALRTVRTRTAG